jgi:hypothetical protein
MSSALYDTIGATYTVTRRTEPRIAAQVWAALGDARTVLNVGAGTGSYEPSDREVTAVEPSAVMRAQRPAGAARCVAATAESLPFEDQSFDAAPRRRPPVREPEGHRRRRLRDGHMYFTRQNPAHDWSDPKHLACAPKGPNSALDEQGPSYVQGRLYFSRSSAAVAGDLYVSMTTGDMLFGPASPIAELNDAGANDIQPNVRKDGREMVFSSNRSGGQGGQDIWSATRASVDDAWSSPVNLGRRSIRASGSRDRCSPGMRSSSCSAGQVRAAPARWNGRVRHLRDDPGAARRMNEQLGAARAFRRSRALVSRQPARLTPRGGCPSADVARPSYLL